MSRTYRIDSVRFLRAVSVIGVLVSSSACNRVPVAEDARDVTSIATHSKRASAPARTSAKTARASAKRVAPSGNAGAAPARQPQEHRAVASAETPAADTPINVPPPSRSITELARAVATLSGGGGCGPNAHRVFVVLRSTDAFLKADASSLRLATIEAGVRVNGMAADGEWRLVRFEDPAWGERAAYVRCSVLELAPYVGTDRGADPSPNAGAALRSERPPDLTVDPRQKRETLRGYLEWQKAGYIIVDGQRVRWSPGTQLELGRLPFISSVPAGYEVVVTGRRTRDGSLMAERIEAKPNAIGVHESELVQQFDEVERAWLASGTMFLSNGKELRNIGRIEDTGPAADRVRRIMRRIVPPYVEPSHIRLHVVNSDEWNARAMGNGAIWVNTGLLNDTSDDELAVVLGHELAHYTHEHTRQSVKNAKLSLLGWESGYSRNLEDQADRVGLRYAYEGGFHVERAIDIWSRVRSRAGVTNWFTGDHSRATDRIRNIRQEIQLNYPPD